MDANSPVNTMQALGEMCVSAGVPLWYEPTSIPKSGRLLQAPAALRATKWLSPNLHELSAMAEAAAQAATGVGVGFEELDREVAGAVQGVSLPDVGVHGAHGRMGSNLATLLHAMVGTDGKDCTFSRHFILFHLHFAYRRMPDGGRQAPCLRVSWVRWPAVGGCCLVADWPSSKYHRHGALICCTWRQRHTYLECTARAVRPA
jgi:hypothetical protein